MEKISLAFNTYGAQFDPPVTGLKKVFIRAHDEEEAATAINWNIGIEVFKAEDMYLCPTVSKLPPQEAKRRGCLFINFD